MYGRVRGRGGVLIHGRGCLGDLIYGSCTHSLLSMGAIWQAKNSWVHAEFIM